MACIQNDSIAGIIGPDTTTVPPKRARRGPRKGARATIATAPPAGSLRGGLLLGTEADFLAAAETIRGEAAPEGVLDSMLVDLAIRSAWRLRLVAIAERDGAPDEALARREARAERSLFRALSALEGRASRRRSSRGGVVPAACPSVRLDEDLAEGPAPSSDPFPADASPCDEASGDPEAWRGRLVFDAEVSADSPVVRGTWITVGHVISLVVDGWTWPDLLRSHPELTEDDLRACLAYHVQEESAGPRPIS